MYQQSGNSYSSEVNAAYQPSREKRLLCYISFGTDMLFVVTVEPLLAFNIVYVTAYTT